MRSVLDDKRRVTIPKPLAEEFDLQKGTPVIFRKGEDAILIKKAEEITDSLEEVMSWDTKRTGKPERISEREMKKIWR